MSWHEIIPGKVALKFNHSRKLFHYFSLGEIVDGELFKATEHTKYQVEVSTVDRPRDYINGAGDKFSTFFEVGSDWIIYERQYGGFKCELLVQGLNTTRPKVYVNKFYINTVKAKIDGLYPVGVHITDILLYHIIKDNDLVVHGASLYDTSSKEAFLLVAPPDTGKTYTTYMLLKKGYKFLGEDLSYYEASSDNLLCMPYTSTWGHRFSFQKVDISKVPFVGLFANNAKKSVEDIFGREAVKKSAKLTRIYLLEKSEEQSIERVKPSNELMRKVIAIQRNEFSYFKNPLLRAFEYYHRLDIDDVYDNEAKNLKRLFEDKAVYVVKSSKYEDFKDLIDAHLTKS